MKTFLQISLTIFVIGYLTVFPQVSNVENYQDKEPKKIFMNSHDPNLKSFPEKSFYKQKEDWQYIIDTTWGSGLPLDQKQQIFNTFTTSLTNAFDGFQSLGMTWASWDSLKNFYYSQIDANTSRGRFAAIMHYLCSQMRDGHTWCDDLGVFNTPLNPGVPFLMFTGMVDTRHFGAVTTVLPDSSVMVLRVVDNHPLNLEPGDIILGYEGIPWKDLIVELMDARLPNNDIWGGFEGTYTDHLFIGAGMNWHLFDTMDVLKYSTGDTVHLSVAPLINLNVPSMMNNEQMEIPNIPFPNYYNGEMVTYGILNNTNIGYIYVLSESATTPAGQQFYQAVVALQNTDALIIDMRWNEGGYAMWQDAFKILSNESFYTIESSVRCNSSVFDLCPISDQDIFKINGTGPTKFDRPIAVLLGPNCLSNGDWNAYRLSYLYNARTFGKPTWASLGLNIFPGMPTNWLARLSTHDMFRVNNPGYYLNRKEFPIDYPVWHNRDDAAQGKDAVVEKALDWINNLFYPHNTITDKSYYPLGEDTTHLSTIIENPNSHQLSARAYLKTLEGELIDSVDLVKQALKVEGENWTADLSFPSEFDYFKISLTVFDETASDHFSVPNATRFTTAGPVTLDSVFVSIGTNSCYVTPFLKNQSNSVTITNASARLICNDPWVTSISPLIRSLPDIPPGDIVSPVVPFAVAFDTSIFPDYFNFKVEILSNDWAYWTDSMRVPPIAIININPSELDFGQVAIDSSATKTFTITNNGDEDLVISNITSSEPEFTVNMTNAVVPPDSSQDVEVTFTATELLTFNGKIEITHNAAGSPDSVVVTGQGVTGIEEELQPLTFSLKQNYPNPFNPTTLIKYSIPKVSKVMLKLFNLLGEEVATLVNEEKVAGFYTVEFNAANFPSGVYFYQIKAGSYINTKKMILLK